MMTKTKDFDCVAMMHRGALRIHETLKGKARMSNWRTGGSATRKRWKN